MEQAIMGRGRRTAAGDSVAREIPLSDGDRRRPLPSATTSSEQEAPREVPRFPLRITAAEVDAADGNFALAASIAVLDRNSRHAVVTGVAGEVPGRYVEVTMEEYGERYIYLCTKA